jgi:hypothetical protein
MLQQSLTHLPQGRFIMHVIDLKIRTPRLSVTEAFSLCLSWAVATGVSSTLGLSLSDILIQGQLNNPEIALFSANIQWVILPYGLLLFVFIGTLTGLAQGLVLKRFLHFRNWWLLLVSNTIGVAVAMVVMIWLNNGNFGSDFALIVQWATAQGLVIGIAQSLVFKVYMARPYWWALSCGLAWLVATSLGLAVSRLMTHSKGGWPFYPLEEAIRFGICWLVASAAFGLITGVALVLLLGQDNYVHAARKQ